jgi:hypothetical protein
MKTTLRAPAELFAISVLAEVAVWEKRLELQRLVRAGEARGKVDAALVATALPGLSDSACRNVLRTIEHIRLIDANGAITAFGKRCSTTGEAPAWELGVFNFLVAKHACFGAWPIAFRREKPDGQDRDFANLVEVPDWFSPTPERTWISGFEDKQAFTLSRFLTKPGQSAVCRMTRLAPAELLWDMDLMTGKNLLHLEGGILVDNESVSFKTHEMTVSDDEVRGYFSTWERRWNPTAGRVLLAYDGAANKDGRDDFLRALIYQKVTAGPRGTFDSVRVDEIPVGPSGAAEATQWAMELTLARIRVADAYVAKKSWAKEWDGVVVGTPLENGAGAAPEVSMVLDRRPPLTPRLRWLLAAGTDLAMG